MFGQVLADDLLVGQVVEEGGGQVGPGGVDAFHLLCKANSQEDEDSRQCKNQKLAKIINLVRV